MIYLSTIKQTKTMRISKEFLELSRKIGWEGETLFLQACQTREVEVKQATKQENMYSHIDFHVSKDGHSFSVDVKGAKEQIVLEYKNVRGNAGWIYGKADYIAFLSPSKDHFLLVPRKKLLDFAKRFKTAPYGHKELYKLYSRKDRDDLMTFVKWEDIAKLKNTKIWNI